MQVEYSCVCIDVIRMVQVSLKYMCSVPDMMWIECRYYRLSVATVADLEGGVRRMPPFLATDSHTSIASSVLSEKKTQPLTTNGRRCMEAMARKLVVSQARSLLLSCYFSTCHQVQCFQPSLSLMLHFYSNYGRFAWFMTPYSADLPEIYYTGLLHLTLHV